MLQLSDRIRGSFLGMILGYSIGQALQEGHLNPLALDEEMPLSLPPLHADLRYLMGLCELYLSDTPLTEEILQKLLLTHYREESWLIGPQTSLVVEALAHLHEHPPHEDDITTPRTLDQLALRIWQDSKKQAAGSGGLKRALLCAYFHLHHPKRCEEDALRLCRQTHPDPRCLDATLAANRLLQALLLGRWQEHRQTSILLIGLHPTVAQALLAAPLLPPQALSPNGYVITSLQAAYHTLLSPAPPTKRMRDLWRGQDRPHATLGLLAGAFLGAAYGIDAFPPAWYKNLPAFETWDALTHTLPLPLSRHQDDFLQ